MRASVEERRDKILHEVMTNGEATVSELADLLGVTTETIRKDLATLEEKNVISKGHGFVTLSTALPETDFSQKETMHLAEKTLVAERAAALVPEGASVFLDTSTTVLRLASLLVMRDDLTVITNSVDACQALARSGNQVLMTAASTARRATRAWELGPCVRWRASTLTCLSLDATASPRRDPRFAPTRRSSSRGRRRSSREPP